MIDVRWGWLVVVCVSIVALMWVVWPNREPPFHYDEVHLRQPAAKSGTIGELCVKGEWVDLPISGVTSVKTICGDGRPLPLEFYPMDLSGPLKGEMKVDKCAEGGKPRDYPFSCRAPGEFMSVAEQTFKRMTWWHWRYETTHRAYVIRGQILP